MLRHSALLCKGWAPCMKHCRRRTPTLWTENMNSPRIQRTSTDEDEDDQLCMKSAHDEDT